jgi:ectoine hydroxylase-related dioxygenase (phytanoyl-CoA dioxygenase family)
MRDHCCREEQVDSHSAITALGVTDETLTNDQRAALDGDGYFILDRVLSPEQCADICGEIDRIAMREGENGGSEVSKEPGVLRISNIFNKSPVFDDVLKIKPVLAAARYLLGDFKVHGANIREPQKGQGKQPLHADTVRYSEDGWVLVTAFICFDDMNLENGPTRVVPGSHRWGAINVPGENAVDTLERSRAQAHRWAVEGDALEDHIAVSPWLGDVSRAPADPFAPFPGEIRIAISAGSIIVMNAHAWHSGTQKFTNARRRQLHLSFTRRDLPQQLIQRNFATPELLQRLGDPVKALLDVP